MRTSLRIKRLRQLQEGWVGRLPDDLAETIYTVQVFNSSRFYLHGALYVKGDDPTRPGKRFRGRIEFRLVARRQFFNRNRPHIISHFVSRFSPKRIRPYYAPAFLKAVLTWLGANGYSCVMFPIHSRKRCEKFAEGIQALGFSHTIRSRFLYRVVVVELGIRGPEIRPKR